VQEKRTAKSGAIATACIAQLSFIRDMSNREPSPEEVQLAVLDRIQVVITDALAELKRAAKERPVNAVAWISRNLVELTIWTLFCIESPANARRFFDDSARDSLDKRLFNGGLQKEREGLLQEAQTEGANDFDDQPGKVREAARVVGKFEAYCSANKLLSKFAHPTAFLLFTPCEELESFRQKLLEAGRGSGEDALRIIDNFMVASRR
jgi:hypothetical protein